MHCLRTWRVIAQCLPLALSSFASGQISFFPTSPYTPEAIQQILEENQKSADSARQSSDRLDRMVELCHSEINNGVKPALRKIDEAGFASAEELVRVTADRVNGDLNSILSDSGVVISRNIADAATNARQHVHQPIDPHLFLNQFDTELVVRVSKHFGLKEDAVHGVFAGDGMAGLHKFLTIAECNRTAQAIANDCTAEKNARNAAAVACAGAIGFCAASKGQDKPSCFSIGPSCVAAYAAQQAVNACEAQSAENQREQQEACQAQSDSQSGTAGSSGGKGECGHGSAPDHNSNHGNDFGKGAGDAHTNVG